MRLRRWEVLKAGRNDDKLTGWLDGKKHFGMAGWLGWTTKQYKDMITGCSIENEDYEGGSRVSGEIQMIKPEDGI